MSIRVTQDVWDHSQQSGTGLIVLLKLADNADEETRIAWPSVQLLAEKCRVSRRTVQRTLRAVEASGEITLVQPATPDHPACYRIEEGRQNDAPGGVTDVTPGGVTGDAGGRHLRHEGGVTGDALTVRGTVREPKESEKESSSEQTSLDDPLVDRLFNWHADRIEATGAGRPRRTQAAVKAARRLLALAEGPNVISQRLDFALGRTYWASKVLTLNDLLKHWPKLTVESHAAQKVAAATGADPDRARRVQDSYQQKFT